MLIYSYKQENKVLNIERLVIMKAVEKAFYNLMFAVEYNEELKPISKITKGKVEK